MTFDADHRPRLADMRYLSVETPMGLEGMLEARPRGPRTTDPAMLADRVGYDAGFLGDFQVPWPVARGTLAPDILVVADGNRLDYLHFSVTMSVSRRMAAYVGVNIDGSATVKIGRTSDRWSLDGRIAPEQQIGEELYAGNGLDRGHLVRREDPNWGPDAQIANDDTFHFTNCAPQMSGFNQRTWLGLESYLLDNTRRWRERITVFSGPIFHEDDLLYRGIQLPTAYWKVVAFLDDDGKPSATAYMIDQVRELATLEAVFGAFKTYQRSIRQIERLTNIDFGELVKFDGFSNEEAATGTRIEAELRSPSDIRV